MKILPITRPMWRRCRQTWNAWLQRTVNKPQLPHPLLSLRQAPDGPVHALAGRRQACVGLPACAPNWEPKRGWDACGSLPKCVALVRACCVFLLKEIRQRGQPGSGVLKVHGKLLPSAVHFLQNSKI